jgi:hypothetical protein
MPVKRKRRHLRFVAGMAFVGSLTLTAGNPAFAQGTDKAHPAALHSSPQMGEDQVIEQTWTTQQGAPESGGFMAQTTDGFLWLGGESGLFRLTA